MMNVRCEVINPNGDLISVIGVPLGNADIKRMYTIDLPPQTVAARVNVVIEGSLPTITRAPEKIIVDYGRGETEEFTQREDPEW